MNLHDNHNKNSLPQVMNVAIVVVFIIVILCLLFRKTEGLDTTQSIKFSPQDLSAMYKYLPLNYYYNDPRYLRKLVNLGKKVLEIFNYNNIRYFA